MSDIIQFEIETLSNLFIGGASVPFEIGGIDQQTILDPDGFPYIPGSSLKGALRAIVRQDKSPAAEEIRMLYADYLKNQKEKNAELIRKIIGKQHKDSSNRKEALERIERNYAKAEGKLSAEYLFGMEGFNNSSKLFFGDALLSKECRNKKTCFSIDMKNSIDDKNGIAPVSNPRSYQTARKGLTFIGEIRFCNMECWDKNSRELCRKYVMEQLMKFNEGIHRLGNSKSRGYGRVKVRITEEMKV
ncbi:RAMP superfamily CRISPR-associated protein [Desulfosporosinus sp. PR]|uniref:RAMP superfamily CRISPR-associated protein n=1 Tax=Candidatus Desulfosporosinus nitrosoreducens TaxID=3401928 RepID=UPI0027F8DC3F|nr:RAMP superfamily CRISPR-associated protein [Desulfosporosinus sp. PR]MDQ7092057.1 RAMP superfamily CRISPR-associated protein [Desulfosporosinus sp. PR]